MSKQKELHETADT